MRPNRLLIVVIAAILVIGGYFLLQRKTRTPAPRSGQLRVTTSFYPLFFFASRIGGEFADVTNITPAGAEPHDYEPTSQEIAHIEESDLLVINGVHLEPWTQDVLGSLTRTRVVVAGDAIATSG